MAKLHPGESVLDVACGTGLVSLRAARIVAPGGGVQGADISDEMVATARERAHTLGIANCRFERMDAEQLAVEAGSVDAVLCALGLMYLPDPERAITEMYRVLRPGGRAVCAVWGERRKCGWADIFPIVDARVQSEVCPMFFRIGTGDCLERAYASAGFVEVQGRHLSSTLDYASAEEACEAAFVGGPVALASSRSPKTCEWTHTRTISRQSKPTGAVMATPFRANSLWWPARDRETSHVESCGARASGAGQAAFSREAGGRTKAQCCGNCRVARRLVVRDIEPCIRARHHRHAAINGRKRRRPQSRMAAARGDCLMCRHGHRDARIDAGIALKTLEVRVDSESDARGLVGIPDVSTALDGFCMSVRIGAEGVDDEELRELAAWGEANSPINCTLRARPDITVDIAIV